MEGENERVREGEGNNRDYNSQSTVLFGLLTHLVTFSLYSLLSLQRKEGVVKKQGDKPASRFIRRSAGGNMIKFLVIVNKVSFLALFSLLFHTNLAPVVLLFMLLLFLLLRCCYFCCCYLL